METPMKATVCTSEIMRKLEAVTGTRFCKRCNQLLPLEQFDARRKRFLCETHRKEAQRFYEFGTIERRALSTLCTKTQGDRRIFGQEKVTIRKKDVIKMLNPDQVTNYSDWALVPRNPDMQTSKENVELVTIYQRRCLVKAWKKHRDAARYKDLLQRLMEQKVVCA